MHVPLDHHGVVPAVESADREVEVGVGSQGNELVAFPGSHARHRFKPKGQTTIHASGVHRFPRRLEAEPACRSPAFDSFRRFRTKPQIILYHARSLQLSGEMIGEIGSDGSSDHAFAETW